MFTEVSYKKVNENAFDLIGNRWMLITAGNKESFNCMTAAWGGFGYLWYKPVTFIYIRPQRYTRQFVEKHDHYTLSFFDPAYRNALNYCGSHSGRDVDKMKATGLKPFTTQNGNIAYEQARLVIECRKLYYEDVDPDHFLDPGLREVYPAKDYHRIYTGEVIACLVRK
jgi:flavin reductase (DIM6/NTAB) family NADH-FMN oxidoreductase RutF